MPMKPAGSSTVLAAETPDAGATAPRNRCPCEPPLQNMLAAPSHCIAPLRTPGIGTTPITRWSYAVPAAELPRVQNGTPSSPTIYLGDYSVCAKL